MINIELYVAIQDEIWRLNKKMHQTNIRPTIYRAGKTYIIESAFYEVDIIWFHTYEMINVASPVHTYIPLLETSIFFCYSESEWSHLLRESGIERNSYFSAYKEVTGRLVSGPLPPLE